MSRHAFRCLRVIPSLRQSFGPNIQIRSFWKRSLWSDPFPEISATMRYMDRQMRDFDREVRRVFDHLDRYSPSVRFPRVPWNEEPGSPSLRSMGIPIEVATDGSRKFKLQIDASQFKPEEVKLNIKEELLFVHAKRESATTDGGKMYEEFTRQYTLPGELNPEDVRCSFSADGILSIEAPLPAVEPPKETEIPVQIEGDKKDSK